MMKLKLLFITVLAAITTSCQFTETMVLNADGSGMMKVEVNLNEMMAFTASSDNPEEVKMDTIIYMKDFLEEKKDSISKLSKVEQEKLLKLKNYNIHVHMDSDEGVMIYDIFTNFKNVSDANDIMNALEQAEKIGPSSKDDSEETKKEDSPDVIGVNYSFEKNIFKRDAYIKDKKAHQKQVDSLKQTEAFFAGSNYSLNYTFPKKIKKVSNSKATLSQDGKGLVLHTPFIDYFKNPDVLDLEVELEN